MICMPVTVPYVGTLCSPNDNRKHPALILLGGSEGGDSQAKVAESFAAQGYVVTSVAYFGAPGTQRALVNVPVETVGHAIDALVARRDVDAAKIGIMGGSKGGELALLAASVYPQIKAVVAMVPSPFAYMGLNANNYPEGCSWTYKGAPLACVPADRRAGQVLGMAFSSGKPVALRPLYDASRLADPNVTAAAMFHLENIAGPVLCLAAADDQLWPSPAQCDTAMAYLKAHGHPYADREIVYPNAGHTFMSGLRGAQYAVTSFPLGGGMSMALGGTPEGDAAAARSAVATIGQFFATALGT